MDLFSFLLIIVLVAALAACYLLLSRRNARLAAARSALEAENRMLLQSAGQQQAQAAAELERVRAEADRRLQECRAEWEQRLSDERASSLRQRQEQEAAFARRLEDEREAAAGQQRRMAVEFENISTRLLQSHSREFSELSRKQVGDLLQPLQADLKGFKEQVEKAYGEEARQCFSLKEQIKNLVEASGRLGEDADNLARALRGDSKMQGNWGEMILTHILEASGLKEGEHYSVQEVLRDEQTGQPLRNEETGSRMQPDVVVHYPGGRDMIIDSKVSLTAYAAYANAADDPARAAALKEHILSVRKHIDELSAKDYSAYDAKAPDFVMMFMPSEPAYLLVLQEAPELWNEAYAKKVVLMSPTNLITALRLALDLWKREYQAQNVQKIVDRGTRLYEKVVTFTETFSAVGTSLSRAQEQYERAFGQLKDGRGSVVSQVEQLRRLGLNPKKRIAPAFRPEEEADADPAELPSGGDA